MPTPLRVLLVEHSEDDAQLILAELRRGDYEPSWARVDTIAALTAALTGQEWDLITCDWVMPQFGAPAALELIREHGCDVPVIIVSGQLSEELAVAALQGRAHDYVSKGKLARLVPAVERELREAERRQAHKRAEQRLRASEEKYRQLVEEINDIVYMVDSEGKITYVSPALERVSGYAPSEVIGRSVAEFIYLEDLAHSQNRLLQLAEGKPLQAGEYRMVTKSGETRWARFHSRPVLDNGRITGWRGVMSDITERKWAEGALWESERRFRQVAENAHEWIWEADAQGLYTYASPVVETILGYKPKDIVGKKHFYDLFCAEDRESLKQTAFEVFAKRQSFREFINRNVHKNGKTVWLSTSGIPLLDQEGALLGYRGADLDITERKRAEGEKAALLLAQREETEIAAALAQVGREMVSSLDTPVILDRLCAVSTQVLECDVSSTLLWTPAEETYQLVAGHGLTEEERALAEVVKLPPGVVSVLFSHFEKDDVAEISTIPEEVFPTQRQEQLGLTRQLCMALRRGGEIIGVQVAHSRGQVEPYALRQRRIARGIAQLASLALENARLAAEANEASRLKSEFVATISHELRTPLNVIMGYTALMLDGEFGPLTTDQTSALRDVSKNSEELLQLISATLDLSRLEKGQVPVKLTETDLSVLLGEISDETRAHWEKPEVSFRCCVPSQLPLLHTDPGKLKVVLKNLIGNAVKFTERGSVGVEAHICDGGVEFGVTDTGIGIAPKDLPIIFEPFRQADGTQTRRYRGAGLGLHIVRRLLDLLRGRITVDSELGRGSTFRVWIPRS